MNYYFDWFLQGPAIWAASCLSSMLVILLLIVNICKPGWVRANFYGIAIPIISVLSLLAFQSKYLAIHVRYSWAQPWVNHLVTFARSYPCLFFKHLLPFYLDIMIVLDCLNRFIIICHPDHIAKVMNWGLVIGIQAVSLLISSAFAFLSAKMEKDHGQSSIAVENGEYTWQYNLAMKIVVNSLNPIFFFFFTIKICSTLSAAAAFLRRSHSTRAHAAKYERIMAFSKTICALVVLFPLVIENAHSGLRIADNLRRFAFGSTLSKPTMSWERETYARYFLDIILCLKSGSYAVAYLWLKFKQD